MKVVLLHLVVFGLSTWPTIAMNNRLLENYERKLNSLIASSDLIRTAGKQRMKRYRCIEEYVDEHGNVIEEGKEHFTTVAPPKLWRSRAGQRHNDKNTVSDTSPVVDGVTIAVMKPNKHIKLHLLKPSTEITEKTIRRKMKLKKKKSGTTRPKPNEDNTGLLRVYATKTSYPGSTTTMTTMTTTTLCPITDVTELTGNENSDDVIMQKFFPQMRNSDSEHFANKGEDEKLSTTPSLPPRERSRAFPATSLNFMEMKSSDENQMDDIRTEPPNHHEIRRHKGHTYMMSRDDYDNEYDDQSDFGDYVPYYRVKLGQRARPYRGLMARKYPSWQAITRARLSHLPPPYKTEIDESVLMTTAPVMRKPQLMDRLRSLPMATQQMPLSPSPVPLPPPPTATQAPLPGLTTMPASNGGVMENSTPQTCAKMRRLASMFGITDISVYARKNCKFLQTFAPGYTCDQIVHFVDSCHKLHLIS